MNPDDIVELLLVEDNPADAELAIHSLRKFKLANNIYVVHDGAEALEFLFCTGAYATRNPNQGPRVVLLDLKLPKVDGLEVLRRIKSDRRTQSLPVVVLTSSHEDKDLVEAYHLGANSYIVKPVDFNQFTEAMRQLGIYWLLLNKVPTVAPEEK